MLPGPPEASKSERAPMLPHANSMNRDVQSQAPSGRTPSNNGDRSPIGSGAKPGSLEAMLAQMTSTLSQKLDDMNRCVGIPLQPHFATLPEARRSTLAWHCITVMLNSCTPAVPESNN